MAAQSKASKFTIREISGSDRQTVELIGRALPYRPTSVKGKQRIKRRDYPGNSVASIQVLGSKEEPLVLRGMWKDVFLGEGQARSLRDRLMAIRRRGRLLEIRFEDILRHGFLVDDDYSQLRPQDIGFELHFEIQSQGESAAPVAANAVEARTSFFSRASDAVTQLRQRITEMEESVVNDGPLGTVLQQGNDLIDLLENAQDSFSAVMIGADMSLDESRNLIARAKSVAEGARALYDELGVLVPQAVATGQGIAAVLNLALAVSDMQSDARDSIVLGQAMESNVLAFTQPDVAAAIVLSPGQDLRAVAAAFLGTGDAWERIADYNGLEGSDQPAGTLVLVPKSA